METETLVYVDLAGTTHLVGRLWARARKNKEGATFEYDRDWLQHPACFCSNPHSSSVPALSTRAMASPCLARSAIRPDRWGRALMRRMERRRAEREGQTPRALREIDYLLLVDDEARQGALRFAQQLGGPFLARKGSADPAAD